MSTGHYKDIIRTTQGACPAPAGRILGSPSMGDPGGALHIWWGVSRVAHIWARTVEGSRVYGWDHCEVQGEMPCLPHTAWPLGDQPKRVLLVPNPIQCTARLCSVACELVWVLNFFDAQPGCAQRCVPRGRLAMGALLTSRHCAASNRDSPSHGHTDLRM